MVHSEPGQLVQLGGQLLGRLGRRQAQDGVEPGALVAGLPMYDSVARLMDYFIGSVNSISFVRTYGNSVSSSLLSETGLGVLTCSRMLRRVAPGGMAGSPTGGSSSSSGREKGGRGAESSETFCTIFQISYVSLCDLLFFLLHNLTLSPCVVLDNKRL